GWIGKNSMLIHPKLGSYFFIGEVFLDQETGQSPNPHPNYCGDCTRCLKGCPTDAFSKQAMLDARKCISYVTLEYRSEDGIDPVVKAGLGNWMAGCDVCQEVCPFNFKRQAEDQVSVPSEFFDL